MEGRPKRKNAVSTTLGIAGMAGGGQTHALVRSRTTSKNPDTLEGYTSPYEGSAEYFCSHHNAFWLLFGGQGNGGDVREVVVAPAHFDRNGGFGFWFGGFQSADGDRGRCADEADLGSASAFTADERDESFWDRLGIGGVWGDSSRGQGECRSGSPRSRDDCDLRLYLHANEKVAFEQYLGGSDSGGDTASHRLGWSRR